MGTTLSRMQLAQRIHLLLLRDIEHAIEVERLLADARYARDVLLVCEAVPGGELAALAALFREASAVAPLRGGQPGHAPQSNDWGHDTSGFGVTQPPPMGAPASRRAGDVVTGAPAASAAPARVGWLPRWRGQK